MNLKEVDTLLEELIDLSNTKYGLIKVGHDTLQYDILFIEKFEKLKEMLGTTALEEVDLKQLPKMKALKVSIERIHTLEKSKQNQNVRMQQAVKAYRK